MSEKTADEDLVGAPALPGRRIAGFVVRMLFRHPVLLGLTLVFAAGVALAELVSIGLVLPFLELLRGGDASVTESYPLAFMLPSFDGMSPEATVRAIAVGLLLVQVFRGLLSYGESRISSFLKIILERDLRQMVFDELLRVELRFIHQEKVANLYTIMHTYPRQAARLAHQYLGSLSKAVVFLGYMWMMIALSWQLTLIAATMGLASTFVASRLRIFIMRIARRINVSRVRLQQVSLESLSAMKLIRLYAREPHARKRFLDEVRSLQRESYKSASITAASPPIQRVMNMGLFAGLLVVATFVMDRGADDWFLLLTVFIFIMVRLMGPLSALTRRQARIANDIPALEEIMNFLERPDKPYLKEGTRPFARLAQGVRFERVGFAYDAAGAPVLRDVSFDMPRGSKIALVGASGSGKSTLVNLLARLSDPTEGRILVDGHDLRAFRSDTWRRRVAVVSQESFLFNDTVRENIRFGRLEATDAEVEDAARRANAHEFILEMEDGYATVVGDRGVRLSGGQAQRIAIARALLADPDVLVLDEATSALDMATERLVQQALEEASRDRTVLAVAHRLSTVRHADLILVLEKGEVVERGTHHELLAKGGRYATYVRMQDFSDAPPEKAAAPPRRVPVEAPAAPWRVVLSVGGQEAEAVAPGGERRRLRIVPAQPDGCKPEMNGTDAVVLEPGAAVVRLHVDGATHDAVPIYARGADGRESRVRVHAVRAAEAEPAAKGLRALARRFRR